MRPLWILFGLRGRIGRVAFALGLANAIVMSVLAVQLLLAAQPSLPSLPGFLTQYGIELSAFGADVAMRTTWWVLGFILAWTLIALGAKRLRDRDRSPWWIVVVVVPLAGLAALHRDAGLVDLRASIPAALQWALVIDSCLLGLWVLAEGLLGPSRVLSAAPGKSTPRQPPKMPAALDRDKARKAPSSK